MKKTNKLLEHIFSLALAFVLIFTAGMQLNNKNNHHIKTADTEISQTIEQEQVISLPPEVSKDSKKATQTDSIKQDCRQHPKQHYRQHHRQQKHCSKRCRQDCEEDCDKEIYTAERNSKKETTEKATPSNAPATTSQAEVDAKKANAVEAQPAVKAPEKETPVVEVPAEDNGPKLKPEIMQSLKLTSVRWVQKGVWKSSDERLIVETEPFNEKTYGYAGPTPLVIVLKDMKIERIIALKNDESPNFWNRVLSTNLLNHWDGMTFKEVLASSPDAVSGATYSSRAIIDNVENTARSLEGLKEATAFTIFIKSISNLKTLSVLLVLIFGLIVNIKFQKNAALRLIKNGLNFAVLGIYAGEFLSLARLTSWVSNGIGLTTSLLALVMLLLAIVLPFFGKKRYYCHNICPMGAMQDLAFKVTKKHFKISPRLNHNLSRIRYFILFALIILMWFGVGFKLLNFEIFSVFIPAAATIGFYIAGLIFLLLSVVIYKPYCTYLCPTGALLTLSDHSYGNVFKFKKSPKTQK